MCICISLSLSLSCTVTALHIHTLFQCHVLTRTHAHTHAHARTHTHSLLSHSAVVARELGLPTIVGVSGGLMKRLKTGMRVHVDAGKGKLTIIRQEEGEED